MALISTTLYKNLIDRLAKQGSLIKAGFNNTLGGTKLYPRVHESVPTDGDFEVENALINSANGVDSNTLSGTFYKNIYTSFVNDLDTHVINKGAPSTDSFLNISGINADVEFSDIWYRVKGQKLNARNVFQSDANILMGTYFPTGSGTGVFTAGTAVGTGTGDVSPTNYAAAKTVLIPVGPVGSDTQFDLRLVREQPTDGSQAENLSLRIPNATTSGTQFVIPIAGNNIASGYLSVSNILAAGGTSGNGFRLVAIRERDVSL